MKRELEITRMERDILKKNGRNLLEGSAEMKYEVIDKAKSEFSVRRLCEFLVVSESGYYAWVKREPSVHDSKDDELKAIIVEIWHESHQIYGLPRIHAELREGGIQIGKQRLARLMCEAAIQGKMPRRKRPRTTQSDDKHSVAPNLLNRQFRVANPNVVWLTDITYIETDEGYLYVAGVLDLGTRKMV